MDFKERVESFFKNTLVRKGFLIFMKVAHFTFIFLDVMSDWVYATTAEFYSDGLKAAAFIFIIFVPFLIYIGVFILLYKKNLKKFFSIWFILGPIVSMCYPVGEIFEHFVHDANLKLMFQFSTIEFLMESLPQLVIQGCNNSLTGNWGLYTYLSFVLSFLSVMRGSYILSTTLYRTQYNKFLDRLKNVGIAIAKEKFKSEEIKEVSEDDISFHFSKKFIEKYRRSASIFNQVRPEVNLSYKGNELIDSTLVEIDISTKISFNKKKCIENSVNLLPILIYVELLLGLLGWICNFVYFVSAEFEKVEVRYVFLLFLGILYIMSLCGGSLKNENFQFTNFIVFRLCLLSHFDYFIQVLYDGIKVTTTFGPFYELGIIVVAHLPILVIQGTNNSQVDSFQGIYGTSFVLNILNLFGSAIRVGHLVILTAIESSNKPNN